MPHIHEIKKGDKDSLKTFIFKRVEEAKIEMNQLHRSWLINLAWVRGKQNVDWDIKTRKYFKSKKSDWQTRLVSNRLLPIVRKNISRLVHTSSVWDVIPATPDEEDIQIARTSRSYLQHLWETLDMTQKLIRIATWMESTSNVFAKVGWDAEVGNDVTLQPNDVNKELLDAFIEFKGLTAIPEFIELKSGNPFVNIVPPFNMIADPSVEVFEDSAYCIEKHFWSRDFIIEKYGTKWKKLAVGKGLETQQLTSLYTENYDRQNVEGITVYEFFHIVSNKFTKGHYGLMTTNGEYLITPKDLPFEHGELPFAHFVNIFDPTSMWGTCIVEQIRSNQARYNMTLGAISDTARIMGKPQWLNPRGSGINSFTNRPGEHYNYRFPMKPEQLQPKPLPAYVAAEPDRIIADIQDTASTHDVTQGKAEPGIRSGTAVRSLQDADDSIVAPVLLGFDKAVAKIGRLLLQTSAEYIFDDRIIQIRGEFNELESISLTGSSFRSKAADKDYWKVRTKTEGRQAMTRAGRESMVRMLLELGLMDPQVNRNELLHIIGTADISTGFDEKEIERTRQWKEIQTMIQADQPADQQADQINVIMFEDHQVHLEMIRKFMSSSKREKLSLEQIQKVVEHGQQHMRMQAAEIAQQQAFVQQSLQEAGIAPQIPAGGKS